MDKMRIVQSSLRSGLNSLKPSIVTQRPFSSRASQCLWNGTTQPYENLKIANALPSVHGQATAATVIPSDAGKSIEAVHQTFVEELLKRAATSAAGLDTQISSRATSKRSTAPQQRTRQHSLSEPQLFRTDGPLTPYPIELDSGEILEPKHATLVRILDNEGEERNIVVAEVEEESGKHRRVLFAVDLDRYQVGQTKSGTAIVGQKITAEDMYATLGLEIQNAKP